MDEGTERQALQHAARAGERRRGAWRLRHAVGLRALRRGCGGKRPLLPPEVIRDTVGLGLGAGTKCPGDLAKGATLGRREPGMSFERPCRF
jgi:hypothetical protein